MRHQPSIEKVALYARVSTKDGRQDTENQLLALREYCAKQGWQIAAEYVDHETGGTSKRVHFRQMFSDARLRKFDLVLFWSLDRLSREGVSATLGHLERLTGYGIGWRSYTEEYLDSTGVFRDAVIAVLAAIAKAGARSAFGARGGGDCEAAPAGEDGSLGTAAEGGGPRSGTPAA
jgi:DNA invertase Pin-like site-specific DNA recombinase